MRPRQVPVHSHTLLTMLNWLNGFTGTVRGPSVAELVVDLPQVRVERQLRYSGRQSPLRQAGDGSKQDQ